MAKSIKAYSLEASVYLGFDNSSLKKANTQIKREIAKMQQHTAAARASFASIATGAGAAFGALAGGFAVTASAAAKFEESFVAVKKTLNVGKDVKDIEKAFDQIANSLINISKVTPVTTKELNEIAAVGGQLGVTAKDIVSFTKTIQKLTVATNLGAEQAALSMARLQEITGLTSRDLDNLGASLVDLGNNFAATESEIVNASLQIATATAQIAGTLNNAAVDALAFSTALRAIGQPAQAGATAIVRLMTEASQAVELGGEKLELFAKTAGVSMGQFKDLFGVDSTRAIAMFIKGLDDTSKVGLTNIEILQQLGLGQVRSRKAILALSKANQTLFDAIDTANTAYIENIALNVEAERRYDTFTSKVQQLKNIVSGGIIEIANDNQSLDGAKKLLEEITNLTVYFLDRLESAIRVTTQFVAPFLVLRGITASIAKNTHDMAKAMGLYATTAETMAKYQQYAGTFNFATGKSAKGEDLEAFGTRAFKGGKITPGDRAMGMIPGFLGTLLGIGTTGKKRRTEDLARRQFFKARPAADLFMQGIDVGELPGIGKDIQTASQLTVARGILGQIDTPQTVESLKELQKEAVNVYQSLAHHNLKTASRFTKLGYEINRMSARLLRSPQRLFTGVWTALTSITKIIDPLQDSFKKIDLGGQDTILNKLKALSSVDGGIGKLLDNNFDFAKRYLETLYQTVNLSEGKFGKKLDFKKGAFTPLPQGYLTARQAGVLPEGVGPIQMANAVLKQSADASAQLYDPAAEFFTGKPSEGDLIRGLSQEYTIEEMAKQDEIRKKARGKKSSGYIGSRLSRFTGKFFGMDWADKAIENTSKVVENANEAVNKNVKDFLVNQPQPMKFGKIVSRERDSKIRQMNKFFSEQLFSLFPTPDYLEQRFKQNFRSRRVTPDGVVDGIIPTGSELATIPGVTGTRGFQKGGGQVTLYQGLEKALKKANIQLLRFISILNAKLLAPIKALGSSIADISKVLFTSITGGFNDLMKDFAIPSRLQSARDRLARQRARTDMSAMRGPRIADVRANVARRINERAILRRDSLVSRLISRQQPQLPAGISRLLPSGVGDLGQIPQMFGPKKEIGSKRFDFPKVSGLYEAERIARQKLLAQYMADNKPMAKAIKKIEQAFSALSKTIITQVTRFTNVINFVNTRLAKGFKAFTGVLSFFATQVLPLLNFKMNKDFGRDVLGKVFGTRTNPLGELFGPNTSKIVDSMNTLPQLPAPKMPALPSGAPVQPTAPLGTPLPGGIQQTFGYLNRGKKKAVEKFLKKYPGFARTKDKPDSASGNFIDDFIQNFRTGRKTGKSANVTFNAMEAFFGKDAASKIKEISNSIKPVTKATKDIAENVGVSAERTKLFGNAFSKVGGTVKGVLKKLKPFADSYLRSEKGNLPTMKNLMQELGIDSADAFDANVNLKGKQPGKKALDDFLDEFYGEKSKGNRLYRRSRRNLVMRGMDPRFEKAVQASREAAEKGVQKVTTATGKQAKVTQSLAQSFDIASASAGKFRAVIAGLAKAFTVLVAVILLAPLAKWAANLGKESKSLNMFKNSLREITDTFQDYQGALIKLEEAEKLLAKERDIFGGNESEVSKSLTKFIEDQGKALAKQGEDITTAMGKNFVENMLFAEADVDEGGFITIFGRIMEKAYGMTEEQVQDRLVEPVGRALDDIITSGNLPTIGEVLDNLLFKESKNLETGQMETILSEYFTGTSRINFEKVLLGTANPGEIFSRYFAAIDAGGYTKGMGEIMEGVKEFADKYTGLDEIAGDELLGMIGRGVYDASEMARFIPLISADDEIAEVFDNVREELQKDFPDVEDTELGKMILDVIMLGSTMEQVIGGNFENLTAADLSKVIPANSDFMRAVGDTLTTYLDEMVTAGYITEDTVLKAQGNVQRQLELYQRVSANILDEELKHRKELEESFGVSSEMALRFAAKVKEAFKQIRKAATDLGKPLEDAGLQDMTMGTILNNLRQQRKAIEEFEKDIARLRAKGFDFSADRVLEMGLSGRDFAKRLLEDSQAATLLELDLMRTAPDLATEVGVANPLADGKYMDQMETIGMNVSKGLIQGIKDGYHEVTAVFGNLGKDILEALRKALDEGSPSREAAKSGRNFNLGIIDGINGSKEELYMLIGEVGTGMVNAVNTSIQSQSKSVGNNFIQEIQSGLEGAIGKGTGVVIDFDQLIDLGESLGYNRDIFTKHIQSMMSNNPDLTASQIGANILSGAREYVKTQQDAFNAVTKLTAAERDRNSALLQTMSSKASLAEQLRRQADITTRLTEVQDKLNILEVEGAAGNVTTKERIGILQQLLSLREMEKRASGQFDARTALNIQQKEQEVNQMVRMYDKGVISALELQVAQEDLAEMKGEFKTAEDKELFFLQLADAEAEYTKMQDDAMKIDQELVSTREQYFGLLDEQEQMTLRVQVAQDAYNASVEGAINAEFRLQDQMLIFQGVAETHKEGLEIIANKYGSITTNVDNLIKAVKEYDTVSKSIFGSGSYEVTSPGYDDALAAGVEGATSDYYEEAIGNIAPGEKYNVGEFEQTFGSALSAAGLSDYFKTFKTDADLSPIFSSGGDLARASENRKFTIGPDGNPVITTNPESEQFMKAGDISQIQGYLQSYADNPNFNIQNFEVAGLSKAFMESLGLNIFQDALGEYRYFDTNLKLVADNLGVGTDDLIDFMKTIPGNFSMTTSRVVSNASQSNQQDNVIAGTPDDTDDDVAGPITDNRPKQGKTLENPHRYNWKQVPQGLGGKWQDYMSSKDYYATNQGVYLGKDILASFANNARTTLAPLGFQFGGRVKGYKMGGRIPDMTHIQPKKYAMGGRAQDHMMKRALVGEYGPEEVRFVPGSGFLVKPLTAGGRGNNTIVQSLSVNVTGIPVDNASARKAAIQIKKALTKLDREGNAGGGVRRT
jgi:TP901 family phage tail tape measure protein